MFMVDLAVPRDIEPEVAAARRRLPPTPSTTAGRCRPPARSARPPSAQAEAIVETGVQSFMHWAGPAPHRAADPGPAQPVRPNGAPTRWPAPASCWPRRADVDEVLDAFRAASRRSCCTARWPSCSAGDGDAREHGPDRLRLFLRAKQEASPLDALRPAEASAFIGKREPQTAPNSPSLPMKDSCASQLRP